MSRWYSKRHYQRLSNGGPVSPEVVAQTAAWASKWAAVGEKSTREMNERFAPITEANTGEAMVWWERRFAELMAT